MPRPLSTDFPAYYAKYILKVDADTVSEAVTVYSKSLIDFFTNLPEAKAEFRYAPGKWTVKELLQHIVDTERIMSYRLLCIARKDKTPLPSFDENNYAAHSAANERSLASIKEEFIAVRKATDSLIASLQESQLSEVGIASNLPVTANAIGFIIFGHILHHKQVLEEKYL
ncbi:MAG: DinB family protein [Chitinophagaceae bacterium]|nr:DinB family protein [Chitinophagaceae bacterium]MDP1763789.1 DinB family protein [Sediminibacterium sp.]MDP1811531.1 DinB family protein [Sediminibacterium sp.]MDP3127289.1 DinB family protein [Sediminibacterium sp.]MDP3665180.1 DinB family protein [Sediminibacterium sp.]